MEKFKRFVAFIALLALVFTLAACAIGPEYSDGGYPYVDEVDGGYIMGAGVGDMLYEGSTDTGTGALENGDSTTRIPSGLMTAGAWSDNANYKLWNDLFSQGGSQDEDGETDEDGKFFGYSGDGWGFDSLNRVSVSVLSDGMPVAGARVVAYSVGGEELFSAVSDASGMAYIFTSESEGCLRITSGSATSEAAFDAEHRELTAELETSADKINTIELMLVVDVTGSMGDEISFLKAELADVISKISENDKSTIIKLALLFYRDTDDRVPFDYYDFTDVTTKEGMEKMQKALDGQCADGGGDYPEAVDEALKQAVSKQWSTGNTTKMIFHILDAPAHTGSQNKRTFHDAVLTAADKGIRICPVICSGSGSLTEYTMREAAIYTGGTFIFVTDDSGIGGEHHDPELPNVTVELLNSLLVRLTMGYHTGNFESPVYWRDDPALGTNK